MATVTIRKQGGAAVMTIPVEVLKALSIGVGHTLEIAVQDGAMQARPAQQQIRRRYALNELLAGVTPALSRQLARESAEFHSGGPIGRELG